MNKALTPTPGGPGGPGRPGGPGGPGGPINVGLLNQNVVFRHFFHQPTKFENNMPIA